MFAKLIVGLLMAPAGPGECVFKEGSWCVTAPLEVDESRSQYGESTKVVLTGATLGDGYIQIRATPGCRESLTAGSDDAIVAERIEMGMPEQNRGWRLSLSSKCGLFILGRGRGTPLGPLTELVASSIRLCRNEDCSGSAAGLID